MSLALAPLELLYGAVTRTRLALYEAGLLRTYELDAPVLSVGNITAGGTGKTPLVEWLARMAAGAGRRVCVLTRGYGRADVRARVLVSDGLRVLASAQEGGDEPRLLAEQLRGLAAVVADADRSAAARWAQRELQSDLFILDDGFQHLRLARDLNIVTLDASAPWGGGHLLPRGRLREPLDGLKRADCIIITRAELAPDLDRLRADATRLSNARPIFNARTQTRALRPLAATDDQPSTTFTALPQPLAAFCALGNPRAFFAQVRSAGSELSYTRAFPDHHSYTQTDIAALEHAARQHSARALITTAKDAVKLRTFDFSLPCFVLEIGLAFDDEAGLSASVLKTLAAKSAR